MAKRFPFVVPFNNLVKNIQSITPKAASNNLSLLFSNANHANLHTQGGETLDERAERAAEVIGEAGKEIAETAWDATKKTAQLVTETTTAEADTNVVDTAEYRSAEDLKGQLGDGCDKIEL